MKKLFSALFAVVLLATSAFANGRDGGRQGSMSLTDTATGLNVKTGLPMNGLLSYKNAMENDVANPKNLDYSVGSATNTFTVSRDSTHPATYFDGNGVMQVTTTSDVARRTRGYYDATGWHAAPGWLLEGASTNLLHDTYLSEATLSDYWVNTGGTLTQESGQNPPYGTNVMKYVASSVDNRIYNESGDRATTTSGTVYTYSCFLKGTGDIYLWVGEDVGVDVYGSKISLTSDWRRYYLTYTASVSKSVAMGLRLKEAQSVTCYATGLQLEAQAYPSSFIPTTTAALTRNAETTNTYATAGNFPAPSGGNCLSFDGQNASGDNYVSIPNSATGNQVYGSTAYSVESWVFIRSDGEGDLGRIWCTETSSYRLDVKGQSGNNVKVGFLIDGTSGNEAFSSSTADVACNQWHHVVATYNGTIKIYVDGVGETIAREDTFNGTLVDDSTHKKILGNDATTVRTFDGFIQCTRIYRNKALSAAEVSTAYAAGRYASLPVSGCTAQYLFNEGTGTTLTDTVAANNGTISGATWSKDCHRGTMMIRYRPIMLPSEQPTTFKSFFGIPQANNEIKFRYGATTTVSVLTRSNNNLNEATGVDISSWGRYSSHTLIATFDSSLSTDAVVMYIDGVRRTYLNTYAVIAGTLPVGSSIQSDVGQAMMLEEMAFWDRVLPQSEVTQIQNRS